jgi:UV DNA damage repair endonuclease
MKKKKEDNQNKNKNKKIKKTIIIERNIPSMTIPSIFKIGYPCQNRTLNLSTNHFFKMSSYSTNKLIETIKKNLNDLEKILDYNIQNNIFFF